ncbi:MAG: tryptophan-rich sensory protein [Candidatus Zambryskibacteria bacterium]|nr:tryptophan-rich sensory protein [Candidatus Zambryskibacteria bacterium]
MGNFWKLIISIAVAQAAGIIGSFFTTPAIPNWYANLARPEFTPPSWVFAPVWTALFLFMGIALFLVWKKYPDSITEKIGSFFNHSKRKIKIAIIIFAVQLILNILWSIIFFGLQSPGWAFIEIIFLWLTIIITIFTFAKISKTAAWLLVPYLLWVSFAAFLNYSIYALN